MSWVNDAIETFDACIDRYAGQKKLVHRVDKTSGEVIKVFERRPLAPLHHSVANCAWQVVITAGGELLSVEPTPEGHIVSVIPTTPESRSRTGNSSISCPHAICEKAASIASTDGYYMARLRKWVESPEFEREPMSEKEGVLAIYLYLKKGTFYQDMMRGIEAVNAKADEVMKSTVKFVVRGMQEQQGPDDLTENPATWGLHIRYMNKQFEKMEQGLCYITGKTGAIMQWTNAPKVRDMAKLILSSKGTGYYTNTAHGMHTPESVCQVSDIAVQKAVNMIRWLESNQSWRPYSKAPFVMSVWAKTDPGKVDMNELYFKSDNWDDVEPDGENTADTADIRSDLMRKIMLATRGELPESELNALTDEIMICTIAAPSIGRMSVMNFQKFSESQLIKNIAHWMRTTRVTSSHNLTTRMILSAMFEDKALDAEESGGFAASIAAAIWNAINFRTPIPHNIPTTAFKRTIATPSWKIQTSEKKPWGAFFWQLDVTCAVINKWKYDNEGGNTFMAKKVDHSIKDRDYLYGRALACYDFLERVALSEEDEAKNMLGTRPTNAWRLMPTFFAMPATVTKRLQMAINPYVTKCWADKRTARALQTLTGILAELGNVGETIDVEEDRIETPLGMNALLGYSAQLHSLGLFFAAKDEDADGRN